MLLQHVVLYPNDYKAVTHALAPPDLGTHRGIDIALIWSYDIMDFWINRGFHTVQNTKWLFCLVLIFVVIMVPRAAFCTPDLTLFIPPEDGGYYDTDTETWVTASDSFTLQAIVDDEDVFRGADSTTLYLCIALSEDLFTQAGTLITIDGVSYTTADFTYGLPPIAEANPDGGGGDMPPHDIYPTLYLEIPFEITEPGITEFEITDASGGIHFDLYTLDGNGEIDMFAPFSKDAATIVPEPSTFVLLGGGLLIAPLRRYVRRKRRQR